MIESTARAERAESLSAASPFYVWEVPEKPLSIHLSLDVVGRLEREAVEAFRSVTSRGSEIGGLLLGRTVPGPHPVVKVEEYESIECDYSRGPLYRLSDKDRERFNTAVEHRPADGKLKVVGFFRTHTRKGLSLDDGDIAFCKERFGDPFNVMLLVRPYATKASTGGFFIWENGQVHGEASYLEFPFNKASLPARDPAAGNANAAPKAPARAQVVPIASRREAPTPLPPVSVKLEPPPPPKPPQAAPEAPKEPEARKEPEKPKEPEAQKEPEKPKEPEARKEPETRKEPEKPAEPETRPEPERRVEPEIRVPFAEAAQAVEVPAPGRKLMWICGAAAVVLVAILGLIFVPGLINKRSTPPTPPASDSTLAFRAERSGGQWLLTWNRESEVVKTATKATLSINDGEQRENVDLDLAQLQNGSIVYSPLTGDVSFRLDVTSSDPAKSKSEYVRALGTRPSAMPETPQTAASAQQKQQQPATAAESESAETAEEAPAPVRAPARALKLPAGESLADRLRPARNTDLPEPPPTLAVAGGAPMPGNLGSPVRAPLPPAVAAPARPAQSSQIGGQVKQATLISRRDPVYPPMARQARVRGTVRVEATVGKDGRVTRVKVLGGHPLLQQAAADAVKQWVYTPTLLNGQPVEFTTHVEVGFNLAGSN